MKYKNKLSVAMYKVSSTAFSIFFILSLCSCHFDKEPAHPLITYDEDLIRVNFIQVDTLAHDTAYVSIGEIVYDSLRIKDSLFYSVKKALGSLDQKILAYNLIKNKNELLINVQTKRGIDTSFIYKYKEFDIIPTKTAKVISGPCVGLYDVNNKRDYHKSIRTWMFDNGISPDSLMIEKMNSLMRQFNYSGWNEYSVYKTDIPILKNLDNQHFRFDADISGDYFYLYVGRNIDRMLSFIKEKVSQDFKGAVKSTNALFTCNNKYASGPNVLFLIGIDKNWNYEILPVGFVIIDKEAPEIYPIGLKSNSYRSFIFDKDNISLSYISWPDCLRLNKSKIHINIPKQNNPITASVSIKYGNFLGDNYFGYDIPFYINKKGDLKTLTIGRKTISASSIVNGYSIRIHFRSLNIGDNQIKISASDIRGNTSSTTMPIPTVYARRNNYKYNYDDDDKYDDLEDRINELEDRLDDIE